MMGYTWNTDGGEYPQVIEPQYNVINVFNVSARAYRLNLPDPGSSGPWLNPQPLQPFGIKDDGSNGELAIFKLYPVEGYTVEHEYQLVFRYSTANLRTDADGLCTQYTVNLDVDLVDLTTSTVVQTYHDAMFSGWLGTGSYRCYDAMMFGYLGNDDATAGDKICGVGIYMEVRHKSTGEFLRYQDAGLAVCLSREWLRNTYHVDINPSEGEPDPDVDDPNDDDDGYSGTGGGDGNHDHSTDDIGVPSLPTLSATGTGFVTLYAANLAQIRAVASELWTSTLYDLIKSIWTDPLEFIIGLTICPFTPPLLPGGYYPTIGNVLGQNVRLNTPLQVVSNQYAEIDCGSINLEKFYGSALDYSPYEKVQIHLPYCGSHDLDVDEVMGSTIGVKYHCDCLTGACVAFVTITNSETTDCVRYQYTGNVLSHVPITERSFDEVLKSVADLGVTIAGTLLSPGPSAGAALGEGATKKQLAKAAHAQEMQEYNDNMNLATSAANVMGAKPQIMRSGSLSTALGLLAVQKPFITRTIPRQSLPKNYSTYEGYPSNILESLGSLKGFTKIYSIRPNGFTCTSDELDEIISLLKGGVIL